MPENMSIWQRALGGLLGTPQGYGMLSDDERRAAQQQGLLSLGAQMMQASGPSPVRTSVGQALGQGLLSGQQAQQQSLQQALQAQLLQSQIKRNEAGKTGATPAAVQEYEYAKANGFQGSFENWKRVASAQTQKTSDIQNWEYFKNLDADGQKQWMALQRQPTAPQLAIVNGVPTLVDRIQGTQTPLTTLPSEIDAAKAKAAAEAEAKARGTATGEAWGEMAKKGINALNVLESLDLAEPLVDAATGSGGGAAADKIASFFGKSLQGDQAIGQLKIIQANLMTNMPRMEGPQSDRDVQLYREAAGELGDPSVPRERKRANLMMIRSLQQKYAESVPDGGEKPKVRRYNPQTGKIE